MNRYKAERLSLSVIKKWEDLGIVTHTIDRKTTLEYVTSAIMKNVDDEEKLSAEVKAFLERYREQFNVGELNYKKMFDLTKKKLAKDRNFIL